MLKKYSEKILVGFNYYIKPHYIISMPEWHRDNAGLSVKRLLGLQNLENNAHKNDLSKKAISKLRTAVNWLAISAQSKQVYHKEKNYWFDFKISFVTLTIPYCQQIITDRDFKTKLLNPFLTYLRKYHTLVNYVWKLEFQSNGTPHIHLTADSFVHHAVLRSAWNRILKANNLLEDYHNRFVGCSFDKYNSIVNFDNKKDMAKVRAAYDKGVQDSWLNPNSTDVHSVKKIKDIAAYICKYMAKTIGKTALQVGRIWGCNYELSRASKTKVHIAADESPLQNSNLVNSGIPWKDIGFTDTDKNQFIPIGTMYQLRASDWIDKIKGYVKVTFTEAIALIRGDISLSSKAYSV